MICCFLGCSLIRLEFNHEQAGYYPELDAVELYGVTAKDKGEMSFLLTVLWSAAISWFLTFCCCLCICLLAVVVDHVNRALGFQTERTVKLLKQLSLTDYSPSEEASGEFGYFGLLPVSGWSAVICMFETELYIK